MKGNKRKAAARAAASVPAAEAPWGKPLKIERVETTVVRLPYDSGAKQKGWLGRNWGTLDYVLVRIDTDAGITGWGDAFGYGATLATKAGVEGHPIRIQTPLQYMSKADIAREADRLGLDAGLSWSCYDPTPDNKHCGLCDSCRLRSKGYEEAGLPDPTIYAARP